MSDEERIKNLEETVHRLRVETTVLKEILGQQIALNNLNYKGKFDDVLEALAKEYAERETGEVDNRQIHDAIREYIKYQAPSVE
ncbi:hypothetical protein Q3V30_15705 [Erwinia pyri]|uniref:Uncharacterized protein n=1 Tax=Erwinia pyri TaxID=3062598 RepID=A0AA50HLW2_9GAMM|nr:hypothetical protein [Erwinia sp. DE2]WLS77902.1 hypothetical protein Q3V30_15705 [Erwinia sp. DE2]